MMPRESSAVPRKRPCQTERVREKDRGVVVVGVSLSGRQNRRTGADSSLSLCLSQAPSRLLKMLKELVRKIRSRSQPELTTVSQQEPCVSRKKDGEEEMSRYQQELEKKFNEARAAKILARCEKENLEAVTLEEECCVCLTAKATVMALPCTHRVTCKKCSVLLIQQAHDEHKLEIKCVLCRRNVDKFLLEKKAKTPQPWLVKNIEPIVPYDLNVPRALGRRCYSVSNSSALPIKRAQNGSPSPSGSA